MSMGEVVMICGNPRAPPPIYLCPTLAKLFRRLRSVLFSLAETGALSSVLACLDEALDDERYT